MTKSLLLVALAIVIGVAGQLSLKLGMNSIGRIGAADLGQPVELLVRLFGQPLVLGAIPLYALGFLVWTVVLSRLNLSFAYPLLALTYVLTPVAAAIVLGEHVATARWLGIAVIFVGVVIAGRN